MSLSGFSITHPNPVRGFFKVEVLVQVSVLLLKCFTWTLIVEVPEFEITNTPSDPNSFPLDLKMT